MQEVDEPQGAEAKDSATAQDWTPLIDEGACADKEPETNEFASMLQQYVKRHKITPAPLPSHIVAPAILCPISALPLPQRVSALPSLPLPSRALLPTPVPHLLPTPVSNLSTTATPKHPSKGQDRPSCAAALHPFAFCSKCDPNFCTYDAHVFHFRVHELVARRSPQKFLGNAAQFCESFFHMFESPEHNLPQRSIFNTEHDDCRPSAVAMVCVINGDFVARYSNCRRTHAEQLMIEDVILRDYISHSPPDSTMKIYLKVQPCHHNGGNSSFYPEGYLFKGKADTRSCSVLLAGFYKKYVQPRNLIVIVAGFYKADWEFSVREDDKITVENSKRGILLLVEAGIKLQAMTPEDWEYLLQFAQGVTREMVNIPERVQTDLANAQFLESLKKRECEKAQENLPCEKSLVPC